MRCENCGAIIPNGSKFCNVCGASITVRENTDGDFDIEIPHQQMSEMAAAESGQENAAPAHKKEPLRTLMPFILVVVGCLFVLAFVSIRNVLKPKDIGDYKYAKFSKYSNSANANNLHYDKIYVTGNIGSVAYTSNDEPVAYAFLTDKKGNNWMLLLDNKSNFDESAFTGSLSGVSATVCGSFYGLYGGTGYPMLFADTFYVGNDVINGQSLYHVEQAESDAELPPFIFIEGTNVISDEYIAYIQSVWHGIKCNVQYGYSDSTGKSDIEGAILSKAVIITLENPDMSDPDTFFVDFFISAMSVSLSQFHGADISATVVQWGDEYIFALGEQIPYVYGHKFDESTSYYSDFESAYIRWSDIWTS